MQKKYAIIVAGGSGSRMNSEIPKQFIKIGEFPILMHTLTAFFKSDSEIQLILVLPKTQIEFWNTLCEEYSFEIKHSIVEGGNSRFQSVRNGLDSITETNGLVAVHDGVRPFITKEIINESYKCAERNESAIAVVDSKDSLRKITDNTSVSVKREEYKIVQTPQTFELEKLKEAYLQPESNSFTDDASVFESNGNSIHLINGNYQNIKITTEEDLAIAEVFVNSKA